MTLHPSSRNPAEAAEEEALRQQLAQLQEQVLRESRMRVAQLELELKQNLGRLEVYDRMLPKLGAFIAEVEAGPAAPGDEALLERLRASRDLYQATKAMVELQNHDYRENLETLRSALAAGAPQELAFSDSTQGKPYLLAKAQVDVASARLMLVDLRDAVTFLQAILVPGQSPPAEAAGAPPNAAKIKEAVAEAPEIKPVLSLAITQYQEAQALIKEAGRTLKGVSEYDWGAEKLTGNTSVFYKLRGKLFYLERLPEQLAPYPELAELFVKAAPPEAPNATPERTPSGRLPQKKGTQPLGRQTRRMMPQGNPFADR